MRIEVKVPVLPESVTEATLVNWHKKAGQSVKRDENLIDIETDKVVLELPAPDAGVLAEIRKPDGSTVTAQEVIAVIVTEGKAAEAAAPAGPAGESVRRGQRQSARRGDARSHRAAGGTQDNGRAEYRCRRHFRYGTRRTDHERSRHRRRRLQGRCSQACTRSRFVSSGSTKRQAGTRSTGARDASRAARCDVAPSAARCRAAGANAVDGRHSHDLQRSEHGSGD